VEEGVKLARELDETKKNLTESQAALVATQSGLKAVSAKLTQVTSAAMPYLKKIVDTLKDKNNSYIELRKEARKVLADFEKS
jgi:ABC-type transporter Mla subunit MlaD